MPTSRAPAEPGVREFETTVERVDDGAVILTETFFYPESGGQPADRGTIDGIPLSDVQVVDGQVVHTFAEPAEFDSGDSVVCQVDPAFRRYCMRAHTASHVLYGAGRRLFDDLGYAGFDIGTEKVRVDLTTAEPIDDADLVELERLANRAVWDALSVSWETMPATEARSLEDIAFNDKTEEGAMDDAAADAVRVVTVEGWDVAACGGTHVSNTEQIGPITVLSRSNPGEDATRIEFAVGPTGIDAAARRREAAEKASQAAGVGIEQLPEVVDRLRTETETLEQEVRDLREEVLGARLSELPTVERGGLIWVIGTVEGFGPNDVQEPLADLLGTESEGPDVAVVSGMDGATFLAVATAGLEATGGTGAGDIVDEITSEFGGGGGGSATFAQGGGLDADPSEIVEFLRESAVDDNGALDGEG